MIYHHTAMYRLAALACRAGLAALTAACCTGCPQAPQPPKPAAPPVIPVSQDISVNLNFVGLAGAPDNMQDFMGRFDSDEFKLFPLRYPVNNFTLYTPQILPGDKMQFAFIAAWGHYQTDLYGLQPTADKPLTAAIPMREYVLEITPKLLKPDKGSYKVALKHQDGTPIAGLDIRDRGDGSELKAASPDYVVRRVFRDTRLRISGYEIWRKEASRDDRPLLGLQVIAEGWGESRQEQGTGPPWATYKKVFPEVDLRVLPNDWFYAKDIPGSCQRLKASAFEQAVKRSGTGADNAGGISIRCYG